MRCGYLGRDTSQRARKWRLRTPGVPSPRFKLSWKVLEEGQRDPRPQWPTTTSESVKKGRDSECGQKKMGAFWTLKYSSNLDEQS